MSDAADDDSGLGDLFAGIRLETHETARPFLICLACGLVFTIDGERPLVQEALLGSSPSCSHCGAEANIWTQVYLSLFVPAKGIGPSVALGINNTAVMHRLPVGRITELDLSTKGVPDNSRILRVVHRGAFGGAVADLDSADSAHPPGLLHRLIGLWLGEGEAPPDIQASTTVLWAPIDADDVGRVQLVAAFDAVANGRLKDSIVPANVAVEWPLGRVMEFFLENAGVATKHLEPFLKDAAYGHQLNVLLPIVSGAAEVPPMTAQFRDTLNRLRKLRNDIAHAGGQTELSRKVVAECVTAAVFGFHYVRLVEARLRSKVKAAAVSNREDPLQVSGDIVNTRPSGTKPR